MSFPSGVRFGISWPLRKTPRECASWTTQWQTWVNQNNPDVSIVVTVYNEAGSLEELYRRTIAALGPGPRTFELIFVDDGSTDGTFAALERIHREDPLTTHACPGTNVHKQEVIKEVHDLIVSRHSGEHAV